MIKKNVKISLQTPDWNEYEQNKSECTEHRALVTRVVQVMTMTILKIYWTDKSLDWLNRHKTLWTVLFKTEWLFRKGPSCQPDFIYVQNKYVFCYLSSHNWGPFFKFANKYVQLTLNIDYFQSTGLLICTRFLKNQFGKIKFDELDFLVYFNLDFYCLCSLQNSISKLIFAG